jgi:hypothetical protein
VPRRRPCSSLQEPIPVAVTPSCFARPVRAFVQKVHAELRPPRHGLCRTQFPLEPMYLACDKELPPRRPVNCGGGQAFRRWLRTGAGMGADDRDHSPQGARFAAARSDQPLDACGLPGRPHRHGHSPCPLAFRSPLIRLYGGAGRAAATTLSNRTYGQARTMLKHICYNINH